MTSLIQLCCLMDAQSNSKIMNAAQAVEYSIFNQFPSDSKHNGYKIEHWLTPFPLGTWWALLWSHHIPAQRETKPFAAFFHSSPQSAIQMLKASNQINGFNCLVF